MTLKSFTLALSLLTFHVLPDSVLAQGGTSTPKVGYLRFWNMLPPASGKFNLQMSGGKPGQGNLVSNAPAYRYASYVGVPVGQHQLSIFKSGDERSPLKTLNVNIQPNSFFTILVSPAGVELTNDTNDSKAAAGTLIVRNFFPGVSVSVEVGSNPVTTGLAYGQSVAAQNQPLARIPLKFRTTLPNGTAAESGAEADFTISKRATVLIIPDSYGDFRPRVTVDGKKS